MARRPYRKYIKEAAGTADYGGSSIASSNSSPVVVGSSSNSDVSSTGEMPSNHIILNYFKINFLLRRIRDPSAQFAVELRQSGPR
jgi:hypothetical protein